jgi:hypothetical protein
MWGGASYCTAHASCIRWQDLVAHSHILWRCTSLLLNVSINKTPGDVRGKRQQTHPGAANAMLDGGAVIVVH